MNLENKVNNARLNELENKVNKASLKELGSQSQQGKFKWTWKTKLTRIV